MTFKLCNYITTQINGKDPKQQERRQESKYDLQKYIFEIIIWNVNVQNKPVNITVSIWSCIRYSKWALGESKHIKPVIRF